jgi:hypothetical protein
MRNLLLCGWLLLPIGAWAYHEGPGQDRVARDEAAAALEVAPEAAVAGDYASACESHGEALELLPAGDLDVARRIRLEHNKMRMQNSELPVAHEDLLALVDELAEVVAEAPADADAADVGFLAEAREALANAQFYTTWLMRLEGRPREIWEPEVEAARQNYRLLAETRGETKTIGRHQSDLESTVRLARLELEDLQGQPLPSE